MQTSAPDNRRPTASRSSAWAKAAAAMLATRGVSANAISLASVGFALLGAASLLAAPGVGWSLYLFAAAMVPLRLLANLLDGMVAVEHARATPTGPLYNEVPDRIADVALIAAAGTAAALAASDQAAFVARYGAAMGWLGAVGALLTAYVRELGRGLGAPADFCGPFAKQQRMWVLGAGALAAALAAQWDRDAEVLFAAVGLIAFGALLTAARRLVRLARHLRNHAP